MRDYYADFLQKKKPENSSGRGVSKVSKGQAKAQKEAFDTFDTPAASIKPEIYQELQSGSLVRIINRFIESGVTFDVSAEKFLIYDDRQVLKLSELQFLKINYSAILCTLQQSLLMKHLFSHSKHSFSDFSYEVTERESFLTEHGSVSFDVHFEAVREVTRKWFADLLTTV